MPSSRSFPRRARAFVALLALLTTTAAAAPLPEVTVTGRLALERKAMTFVYQIAELQNREGMPRWNSPVCPSVQGLPRQEGEYVLARLSEIAREAEIPLAGENCHPNLYIIMTAGTGKLLRQLPSSDRMLLFGHTAPSVIDAFIARPDVVRVWYNTSITDAWGKPAGSSPPSGRENPTLQQTTLNYADSSRIIANVVWRMASVFVLVDQTQMHGVSRGQFADYVAMVSFAQIKPQAPQGDTPTILKLFQVPATDAPPGMSEWDRAFLKGLYATNQRLKMQRNAIAHSMVDEIAPR